MKTKTDLLTDITDLARTLTVYGEGDSIPLMKWELVHVSFKEFICSETFTNYQPERKKEVFDLYESLGIILDELEEFRAKYPQGISEGKLAVL